MLFEIHGRCKKRGPDHQSDLPEPMKLAAHLSHYALYGLMIAMPLLGWGCCVGLILLDVAAALFHALVRRDGVFEAMASVSTQDEVMPAE